MTPFSRSAVGKAAYKDGALSISVPKPEQAKPKAIKVQIKE